MLILDAVTLAETHPPVPLGPRDARPTRIAVSERLGLVVVGLAGGGRVAAYRLPSLALARGFPVQVADDVNGIAIDEVASRAWVIGDQRYAVVDLLNPARTERFEAAFAPCEGCVAVHWGIVLAPHRDRAFVVNRRQAMVSLVMSTGLPAPESPGDPGMGSVFYGDLALHPRTGEILLLGVRSVETPVWTLDPHTFEPTSEHPANLGGGAVDIEVLP